MNGVAHQQFVKVTHVIIFLKSINFKYLYTTMLVVVRCSIYFIHQHFQKHI